MLTPITRHRLIPPYRAALALMWCIPPVLLTGVLIVRANTVSSLIDPRYWLMLALMLLPALYIWREGIDVLRGGLRVNQHIPHTAPYSTLSGWRCDSTHRILTIWDDRGRIVFEMPAAHLSDVERVEQVLRENVKLKVMSNE